MPDLQILIGSIRKSSIKWAFITFIQLMLSILTAMVKHLDWSTWLNQTGLLWCLCFKKEGKCFWNNALMPICLFCVVKNSEINRFCYYFSIILNKQKLYGSRNTSLRQPVWKTYKIKNNGVMYTGFMNFAIKKH